MFHSIRWRLVLSFVLLTLLTVGSIGVLALTLIERYIDQQEVEHLTANAEAVARQALFSMQPIVHQHELQELAETASRLGNAQIRILDGGQRVMADSGPPAEGDELVWVLPHSTYDDPETGDSHEAAFPYFLSARGLTPVSLPNHEPLFLGQAFTGTEFMIVRSWEEPWGSRFIFVGTHWGAEMPHEVPTDQAAVPRSDRAVSVSIGDADRRRGFVEISNGLDYGTEALTTARQAFLIAAGAATLLAVGAGLLVSRGLSAPVRALKETASEMSGGDLSIRAPVRGRGEIAQLAQQFNQMAERLEASFGELAAERDALRRFIADASHELRTPITALRNFIDLLQGAAADDQDAQAEFLAESQAQIDRLEWITGNLLDLSRLDAGLMALDMADHDAAELIEAAAAPFKAMAQEKGIALSIQMPSAPLNLHCDRTWMEMALSNLLDNALKFAPAGRQVDVGAEQQEAEIHLWVQDDGPGIDPVDQPHIFERFYRGQGNGAKGSGLGLAIVRSIAQAHGGRAFVESEPGVGSRFVIELPGN